MMQKAASLYDAGGDMGAGEAGNMAKYAAGRGRALAVDTAVQTHGGNGLATEYGVATLLGAVRAGRIAPVSREMILNFVAQQPRPGQVVLRSQPGARQAASMRWTGRTRRPIPSSSESSMWKSWIRSRCRGSSSSVGQSTCARTRSTGTYRTPPCS